MPGCPGITAKTFFQFAKDSGIPPPSADRYVKKCVEEGKLEKVERGNYRKRRE
ncbi:MAG: type IV toxin-antitoxin system AbiEi family antitoxin domain-containing protein [Bacteroidia bacterium]|nr:type IV toxin-antitoxin system AbiEi family antitoxin domain-containing protein [Bacteroidia bacterium]